MKLVEPLDDVALWRSVVGREKSSRHRFVYGVVTTQIYCRAGCPSRLPRRENVRFFRTPAEAEKAGFRPCKRCQPKEAFGDSHYSGVVARACAQIEQAETGVSLKTLADAAGLSPDHFQRVFSAAVGLTPKAYEEACRHRRMRSALTNSPTITDAAYSAGFSTNSRFYAKAEAMLGMLPRQYRSGGRKVALRFALGACSLGSVLVAASEKGVAAVYLGDDPEELIHLLVQQFPRAELVGGDRKFEDLVARVIGVIENFESSAGLPLDIRGTAFQHRVWKALTKIPAGETLSYSQLAEIVGQPAAVRAVASACGANQLAVIIPCHRVVRRDGALGGYRWGIERKQCLLDRENRSKKR